MMPGFYNHNYQMFQAPGYVVIFVEMMLYEYACHEGNYGLENILAGARAAERTEDRAAGSR